MAYQTRRQIKLAQEKRERFYNRMMWVQASIVVAVSVYCIVGLGL